MKRSAQVLAAMISVGAASCAATGTGDEATTESTPSGATTEVVSEPASAPTISFVPAQGCDGIGGTWRGQAYSEPHGGYYDFTLHVAPRSVGVAELVGSMLVRSWEGSPGDIDPPESCGEHYHWTVLEEAAGHVDGTGAFAFEGTSWKNGENLCGEPVTDYSLDRIDATPAPSASGELTSMTGTLSDRVVWKEGGLPMELTRVECL